MAKKHTGVFLSRVIDAFLVKIKTKLKNMKPLNTEINKKCEDQQ